MKADDCRCQSVLMRPLELGKVGRRVVQAGFDGSDIISDGGVALLKQLDERIGFSRAAARALGDERRSASAVHRRSDVGATHLRDVSGLIGCLRPQCAAQRSGDADGRRSRRAAGVCAHAHSHGDHSYTGACRSTVRCADAAVHRQT